MNILEDRLRDALRERAARSSIDPDAWARTLARTGSRRRGRAPGWSRFLIPAAAAAAVIAIVVGATALTGHEGLRGAGGTGSVSPSSPAAPAPPGRNDYLIQQDPPVSAIVQVKTSIRGLTSWTFVWFSRLKADPSGTVLCSETKVTGYPTAGDCWSAQIPAGHAAGRPEDSSSVTLGPASAQVASVSAQWPGGHGAGTLISGRGFPARVWLVSDPVPDGSQIVFRNARGLEVGELTDSSGITSAVRRHGQGITVARYPDGFAGPTPGTITAYLADGRAEFWDSDSGLAGLSNTLASDEVGLRVFYGRAEPPISTKLVEFLGYAPQNVARVTLRMADGRQFSARTIAGWPGSGLRLWSFPVPEGLSWTVRYVALGYDAANQVVSQLTVSFTQ